MNENLHAILGCFGKYGIEQWHQRTRIQNIGTEDKGVDAYFMHSAKLQIPHGRAPQEFSRFENRQPCPGNPTGRQKLRLRRPQFRQLRHLFGYGHRRRCLRRADGKLGDTHINTICAQPNHTFRVAILAVRNGIPRSVIQ